MAKKHVFIQDAGIFGDEFVVSVGLTGEELKKWAKKNKLNNDWFKAVFEDCEFTEEKKSGAAHTYFNTENNGVYMVSLSKYEDTWNFWTTVIHEVVHVVQRVELRKELQKEDEAKAYLTEYLFNQIRRKIQKGKHRYAVNN